MALRGRQGSRRVRVLLICQLMVRGVWGDIEPCQTRFLGVR